MEQFKNKIMTYNNFFKNANPLFNFDNPLAIKNINGIIYKITDENIRLNGKKLYTLYMNSFLLGNFNTVNEAKNRVKNIKITL